MSRHKSVITDKHIHTCIDTGYVSVWSIHEEAKIFEIRGTVFPSLMYCIDSVYVFIQLTKETYLMSNSAQVCCITCICMYVLYMSLWQAFFLWGSHFEQMNIQYCV